MCPLNFKGRIFNRITGKQIVVGVETQEVIKE